MKAQAHLIIQKNGRDVSIVSVRQTRPALAANQAAIHMVLDLPDDFFLHPSVTVPITKPQIAVAVDPQEAKP